MIPLATNNFGVTSHISGDTIPGVAGTGLSPLMSSISSFGVQKVPNIFI
jgi:hypothetical protein